MASRRLRTFKQWMNSSGIEYSDALDFTDSPENGISVIALRDLKEGDLVATIPKHACLTVKTSGACETIEYNGLGGSLGLAVAIMYEKSLGKHSPWAGYLQVSPERECLPLVWTLDEIDKLLQGTELHETLKEDKALVYEDWKDNILPLTESNTNLKPEYFGVEQYLDAKSLISSRSFEIDDYHGLGMVPLADLFNHKTGAEDVHFTSSSSHSEDDDDDDDDDDDSTIDVCNGDNASYDKPSSELESSSDGWDDSAVLEMIMVKDVKAGAEVFNTYGLVGNAALLHRYGFTEPDNPYDIVNIDLELVLQWSSSLFSGKYSRARLSLWRKLGYSDLDSENTEYFEISYAGEPQIELLILLYIMLLQEDHYHKLDLAVSTANKCNGSLSLILLEVCNIRCNESSEVSGDSLLTENVCSSLLWLADKRESLYGSSSLKDDIQALKRCCMKDRKLYHSLILRVSERRILEKLRTYAAVGAQSHKSTNKINERKRLKRT